MNKRPPEICPVCGEDVPRGSLACPECGADHRSGWAEDADVSGGLDLPDENFDYGEFLEKEFGDGRPRGGVAWLWWAAAAAALISILAMCLGRS